MKEGSVVHIPTSTGFSQRDGVRSLSLLGRGSALNLISRNLTAVGLSSDLAAVNSEGGWALSELDEIDLSAKFNLHFAHRS